MIAEAYTVHYCVRYHPGDYFRMHLYFFILAQLAFFAMWGALQPAFPWFVVTLAVWGFILLGHYYVDYRRQISVQKTPVRVQQPPTPTPEPQIHVEKNVVPSEEEKLPRETHKDVEVVAAEDGVFSIEDTSEEGFTEICVKE